MNVVRQASLLVQVGNLPLVMTNMATLPRFFCVNQSAFLISLLQMVYWHVLQQQQHAIC